MAVVSWCARRPSETDPWSRLEGVNITPTHLCIYVHRSPNACRVAPVQIGYSTFADYFDPEFLNHLSAPPTTKDSDLLTEPRSGSDDKR